MATTATSGDGIIGVTIAGRYRVISQLGVGGMGTAYRAWDERQGVPVVVKIPKRVFLEDPKFAERFHREIRLLQGFRHPHIVPIIDVGEHDGLPFVVMRFLPGGSLSNRRLRDPDGKPLVNPAAMLQLWLPAVAEALDHVHAQGVVHRDVKPANIFFDAFWGASVGDFGIAKVVAESDAFDKEQTLTATHMGIGTQEYMAPEQFTPKAVVDGRVDQYALAVIVYELLAGARPFTGSRAHLIVEVTTLPVEPLSSLRRDLPPSLVAAVQRGLAKRPGERFASCREFAAAVLADVPLRTDEPGVARLLCPQCANMLKLPTTAAGRKGKCPRCQTEMKVADDLGALWLLGEAAGKGGPAAGPATAATALPTLMPVSSTTPIEKASPEPARRQPTAIWAGVAAVAVAAAAAAWTLAPAKRVPPPKPRAPVAVSAEQQLATAKAVLGKDPDNRAANEIVGRHACFREGNWERGLPLLVRGGGPMLAAAAEKEVLATTASPFNPGQFVRAAQFWWKLADQPPFKAEADAIRQHAADLYTKHVAEVESREDIRFIDNWLDNNEAFRERVRNQRPRDPRPAVEPQALVSAAPPPALEPARNPEPTPPAPPTPPPAPAPVLALAPEIADQPVVTNSIGVQLRFIPAGTFRMGDDNGHPNEKPAHEVTLTKPFSIGVCEVTNGQWRRVMGSVPSRWKDDDRPVEQVSWQDAVDFCQKLSALPEEQKAGRVYRLPTEAEWEYACRAGTDTKYSFGDDQSKLGEYGWFSGNSDKETHPVGKKKPNAWGLYDMHGNVLEWCSNWDGEYPKGAVTDPQGPSGASARVFRGGWYISAGSCRSAHRDRGLPSVRFNGLGFRLALSPSGDQPPLANVVSAAPPPAPPVVAKPKPATPPAQPPAPPAKVSAPERAFKRVGRHAHDDIDAAVAAYNEAIEAAIAKLAPQLQEKFDAASRQGQLELAGRYELAVREAAAGRFLPRLHDLGKSARNGFDKALRAATRECSEAYQKAQREAVQAKDLKAAADIRVELAEFLAHGSHRPPHVPTEAVGFRGHWYLVSPDATPFEQALAAARAAGGSLVVIDDRDENDFVRSLVPDRPIRLGLVRVEGIWMTTQRRPVPFFLWDDGQPSNGETETFVAMIFNGRWHDYAPESQASCVEWE